MVQLLQNLLNNALSYHEASPPDVRTKATHGVGEWVFNVADNGIGIGIDPIHHKKFSDFQALAHV